MSEEVKEDVNGQPIPKASWMWLKDTKGYPSVTVTFVTVAFWVTTFAFLASVFGKIGPVEFKEFNETAVGVYLTPLLSLYFGRKWTEAKFNTTPGSEQ